MEQGTADCYVGTMLLRAVLVVLCLSTISQASAPLDVARVFILLKDGEALTTKEAAQLETRIVHKINDEEDRLRLLSFYAQPPSTDSGAAVRQARLHHISWLVENDPKSPIFSVAARVYAIQTVGGPLADPAAFQVVKEIWQSQIKAHPDDLMIKRNAASFLEIGDPEITETLLTQTGDRRWLGQIYAKALLGIVAVDYRSGDPVLVDEARRNSEFGKRAQQKLDFSDDVILLGGAIFTLYRDGGILYTDNKLNGDYFVVANRLRTKAEKLDPGNNDVFSVIPELPKAGEPPPRVVRFGGAVAQKILLSHTAPSYPVQAKADRVEGVVRLNVLIGPGGQVRKVYAVSGPAPLRNAATDAVKQWTYSPTRLNGNPVYVLTVVDVHFRLY